TVYGRTEEEARGRLRAARSALEAEASRSTDVVPDLAELRRRRAAIQRLARSERATNVRVFCSVGRGEAPAPGDYHLVVDLDAEVRGFEAFYRLDRLEQLLTDLLSRPVHVVTARHNSEFTRRVLRDAVGL